MAFFLMGRAQLGEVHLGKSFLGQVMTGRAKSPGVSTLPVCRAGQVSCAPTFYRFTGNGTWSLESNWQDNRIPPAELPAGQQIIIEPESGGECLLNIPQQTIPKNASFQLATGKRLTVLTKLVFQN